MVGYRLRHKLNRNVMNYTDNVLTNNYRC